MNKSMKQSDTEAYETSFIEDRPESPEKPINNSPKSSNKPDIEKEQQASSQEENK